MATSGTVGQTTTKTSTIVEHALRRCGIPPELQTPEIVKVALNNLFFLLVHYANRGINLWCIEEGKIDLVAGTKTYVLPDGTLDLLNVVLRKDPSGNYVDVPLYRMNIDEYSSLPNKDTPGQYPFQYIFNKLRAPEISVWPVPNNSDNDIVYWRHRQIEDVGTLTDELDIPTRWLEATIWQLAVRLSMEVPGVDAGRVQAITQMSEKYQFEAEREENDHSHVYIVPKISGYT